MRSGLLHDRAHDARVVHVQACSVCGTFLQIKQSAIAVTQVLELAALVKTKQISSVELTTIFLKRSKE